MFCGKQKMNAEIKESSVIGSYVTKRHKQVIKSDRKNVRIFYVLTRFLQCNGRNLLGTETLYLAVNVHIS